MRSPRGWNRSVRRLGWSVGLVLVLAIARPEPAFAHRQPPDPASDGITLRAGAATLDITPPLGTSINGHMNDRRGTLLHDPLQVRAVTLEAANPNAAAPQVNRVALVTVDTCLLSNGIVESVRERLARDAGFPPEALVISATHTHSGGTLAPAFQSQPDPSYVAFVTQRIGDAVLIAYSRLTPARIGWGVGTNNRQVFNRRFFMKPGVELVDPFGKPERVKMNPGVGSTQVERPAGPVDPEVAVLRIDAVTPDQTARPLAVYANYPLHYVGDVPGNAFSADYFGAFAARLSRLLQADDPADHPPFVALLSNGASGDINNIDVMGRVRPLEEQRRPQPPFTQIRRVADDLAQEVRATWENIETTRTPRLAALSDTLTLGVRKPNPDEVERARRLVQPARDQGRPLKTLEEIYAGETLDLTIYPDQVEVTVSAVRVGDGVLVAIPGEPFVEIGLAIKKRSPFKSTVIVGLANGYYGYLPTKSDFELGGYETWRAKSSYLEPGAAAKIQDAVDRLLQRLHSDG